MTLMTENEDLDSPSPALQLRDVPLITSTPDGGGTDSIQNVEYRKSFRMEGRTRSVTVLKVLSIIYSSFSLLKNNERKHRSLLFEIYHVPEI